MSPGVLFFLAGFALAGFAAAAPSPHWDLVGEIAGSGKGSVQVTLFAVEEPYNATAFSNVGGEFRFNALPAGMYTVSILKRRLGAVRRTVDVSPSLADNKGVVHVVIPYEPTEAAGVGGGTVSATLLTVPARAKDKAGAAQRLLSKHDVEGAKRSLKEAVELAPKFAQAWNALGMIAYQTHDLPAAEHFFRTAIAADSSATEASINLGGVLLSEGAYQESLVYNQRALISRPADPLANVQAGIAYFALEDYDRAEAALLQTVRVDPAHFSKPQLFLADIYLHRGNPAAAADQLKDYLARHPDAADVDRQRQRLRRLEQRPAP